MFFIKKIIFFSLNKYIINEHAFKFRRLYTFNFNSLIAKIFVLNYNNNNVYLNFIKRYKRIFAFYFIRDLFK